MLGILFLIGSALVGVSLVRRVMRQLLNDGAEQIMWGTVVGWTLTIVGVYSIARWQGQLTYKLMVAMTIAVWITSAALIALEVRMPSRASSMLGWRRHYVGLGLVLVVFTPVYWRLLSTHVFAPGQDGLYSGGSAGYDLNFHAAVATSFVYGNNFPPVYTLLSPEPILYPYMPDFHAAALMAAGLSLRAAFIITALVLGFVTAGLLYSLALRITRSQLAATLATVLFLLNGGTGFIDFFRDWWISNKSFFEFWNTLGFNYAKLSERHLHWTNIVTDMLIPQRASLFGLPLGLIIFTIFCLAWQRWHSNGRTDAQTQRTAPADFTLMFVAGVLTGLLPLFHTHTYISVGLVSVILFAFRPRWQWVGFWIPALVLAAPQLIGLAQHATETEIVRWLPGWLGHDDSFFPAYLLRNFGLPLLLAFPAWFAAPREWRTFYLAFVFLLVFSFTIVVSPNSFDNGKPTYYWHAINSILVAGWLIKLGTVHRQRLVAAVLAFFCIATGLTVLQSESLASMHIFSGDELNAAAFVREHTPPRSVFLTAPSLNQPVLCLSGRAVVRGATAWVWSHGYEFREREADVRRMYAGTTDALELLRYYNVDYIYLSDTERHGLQADESFFEKNFSAVYRNNGVTIYDTHTSRSATAPSSEARASALNQPAPRELSARLDRDPYPLLVKFPRTSFFVYRLCKASYGRMPRRDEFMTAMSQILHDVFKGKSGWENQIEANRNILLNTWTSSKDFKQFYDSKTNAEFVNALLTNSRVNWSADKRDALIKTLDSQATSRESTLLTIVEDKSFFSREYNTAYVLVHFFGYLRRNADDPPDGDLRGLIFWRDNLDLWGDYSNISRAFIESIEYNSLKPVP